MEGVRGNFEPGQSIKGLCPAYPMFNVRSSQQLGQLALEGVRLDDRKADNMMQNKMTGRPMELDFGIADRVTAGDQVMGLADATVDGFRSAGIGDISDVCRDTVYGFNEVIQID